MLAIYRLSKTRAIPLMDHIIVSRNTYFSFAQKGLLQPGLS